MVTTSLPSSPGSILRVLAAAALLMAALPATAAAQPSDLELGDKASFLILFPQLRNLAAPAAVQRGLRVTYSSGATSGPGGPAGGGLIQFDVVSRDGQQVLLQQSNYGNVGDGVRVMGSGASRGLPGLGPFWINPTVLPGAEALGDNNLSVTRYDKQIAGGQTVNVVRFQTTTTNGSFVTEYDTATGLMVFDSFTAGPSMGQLTLAGARQLQLPWADGRAPNWVRPNATLSYTGTQSTAIEGAASLDQPAQASFAINQAGARWSLAQGAVQIGAVGGESLNGTGSGQLIGALWLPVTALAVTLDPAGARIDADPVTGAELYLGRADNGGVILQEVLPASRVTWIYHPTLGVLDRNVAESVNGISFEVLDVARVTDDATLNTLAQQPPLPEAPTDPNPNPTDPNPNPTDPNPTDPNPTDPNPTDPNPTDPNPADPNPTDPGAAPSGGGGGCATGGGGPVAPWALGVILALLVALGRRVRGGRGEPVGAAPLGSHHASRITHHAS